MGCSGHATAQGPTDPLRPVVARARYMMGEHPDLEWPQDHALAWEGLLEVARRLRRDAEALLECNCGLSISMLGILGRLLDTPDHTLRQTDLADAMDLSVSRISRVIDLLVKRGMVGRHACPSDGRAVHVRLTENGFERAVAAQKTTFEFVQQTFTDQLDDAEIEVLARVFSRLMAA